MSFIKGQVDRFGRPIPASPGYQVLINADGSEVQQRNRLIIPASLIAADSPDNDATSLSTSPSVIPDKIFNAAIASAASWSVAFTAGKYRRIEVHVKTNAGSGNTVTVKLDGLSAGTYYTSSAKLAAVGAGSAQSAQDGFVVDATTGAGSPFQLDVNAQIATDGSGRTMNGIATLNNSLGWAMTGVSIDTTHDVTGVTIVFSTAAAGWLEVIGYQ